MCFSRNDIMMNEADAKKTLTSAVISVLSNNKWQSQFQFSISNSSELAEDIAEEIFDNCKHCFAIKIEVFE